MAYSTADFLRDTSWKMDKLFIFYEIVQPKIKAKMQKVISNIKSIDFKTIWKNSLYNLPHGVLIVFLGFLAAFTLLTHAEQKNGIRVINLRTSSMSPKIPIASVVVTKPAQNYKVGDIITYQEKDAETGTVFSRTLTHRIIDIKKKDEDISFITKGDANEHPDPYEVKAEDILGKVFLVLPVLGILLILVQKPLGFLILIALPSAYLIMNEVNYIKKEVNAL